MKTLRLLSVAVAFAVSGMLAAQVVSSNEASPSPSMPEQSVTADGGFMSVKPSYLLLFAPSGNGDNSSMNGFSLGWSGMGKITKKHPLFFGMGFELMFARNKESETITTPYYSSEMNSKFTYLALNVPVNLGYLFQINDKIAVMPYFGIDFRANLLGKMKMEIDGGESSSYDVFYDSDMEDFGQDSWKKFSAGWHVGLLLDMKKANFSLEYGSDMNKINGDDRFKMLRLSLGIKTGKWKK